jgi:hypothetical protein
VPIGPGRYDFVATELINSLECEGVLVVVCGGRLGSGSAVQATAVALAELPRVLRLLADDIESDAVKISG